MNRRAWDAIAVELQATAGISLEAAGARPVGGGSSINAAWRARSDHGTLFVKLNHPARRAMFAAEARGLELLAGAQAVRVPTPLAHGASAEHAYLVLEWLDLQPGGAAPASRLGTQLAALHRCTGRAFGLDHDNTIGSTEQPNAESDDWIGFLQQRRLGFQLELAARHGLGGRLVSRGERLLGLVGHFFRDYRPQPSLLHGDLWGGNWGSLADATPVIFDPAVYFGDRETDLAMTELFGGFPAEFYAAYDAAWPRDPGYSVRRDLYQLYHVLNHANLFGRVYTGQAGHLIERLIAAAGG